MTRLKLNGDTFDVHTDSRELLSDVLRRVGLRSVHVGCEEGVCGACTVLLDGAPVRACLTLAASVEDRSITTLEGVDPGLRDRMQSSFSHNNALQCGYCSPGFMLLLAYAATEASEVIAEDQLVESNLCRCTGYEGIRRAFSEVLARDETPRPSGSVS